VRKLLQDSDAWNAYPEYRKWFDKLYLSTHLGYNCGPSGVPPLISGTYIVRPTYNLSGMGAGARIENIPAGDCTVVPPGYFWCDMFYGEHISVNYSLSLDGKTHTAVSAWLGEKSKDSLRFSRWTKTSELIDLPAPFKYMTDVSEINAEFIGGRMIEIHFRQSPDPECDEFIPVWADDEDIIYRYLQQGYTFIKDEDDANGFLDVKRKGFLINDQYRI
jgi:hypothetical protein